VFDQTQTAIAGWRKILGVLDMPVDVVDADPGAELPDGPLGIDVAACPSPTAADRRCCTTSTSASRRAPTWPSSARPARARPPSPSSCAAWPIPPRACGPRRRRRPAHRRRRGPAPPHPHGAPGRLPLRRHARRERAPGRAAGRGGTDDDVLGAFDALGLGGGSDGCPRARHPRRRAGRQPLRGRAPARRPRPRPAGRARVCSSSTRPRAPSTPRPSRRSPARSPGCRGAHRGQHRPPAVHRRARRPRAGVRPRPPRRAGPPRRAAGAAGGTYARMHRSWIGATRDAGTGDGRRSQPRS
jgi:hypothetical protein